MSGTMFPNHGRWKSLATSLLTNSPAYNTFLQFSRAQKIARYKFSTKIRCCFVCITSSSTYVTRPRNNVFAFHGPESTLLPVPESSRPKISTSSRPRIPESPRPHVLPISLLVTACHGTIRREPSSNQIEPGGTNSSTRVRRRSSF